MSLLDSVALHKYPQVWSTAFLISQPSVGSPTGRGLEHSHFPVELRAVQSFVRRGVA